MAQEGYDVIRATDGATGLNLASEVKPDLIRLYIMLPILDGLTVCCTLRRETSTPIVLLTARSGEVDRIVAPHGETFIRL